MRSPFKLSPVFVIALACSGGSGPAISPEVKAASLDSLIASYVRTCEQGCAQELECRGIPADVCNRVCGEMLEPSMLGNAREKDTKACVDALTAQERCTQGLTCEVLKAAATTSDERSCETEILNAHSACYELVRLKHRRDTCDTVTFDGQLGGQPITGSAALGTVTEHGSGERGTIHTTWKVGDDQLLATSLKQPYLVGSEFRIGTMFAVRSAFLQLPPGAPGAGKWACMGAGSWAARTLSGLHYAAGAVRALGQCPGGEPLAGQVEVKPNGGDAPLLTGELDGVVLSDTLYASLSPDPQRQELLFTSSRMAFNVQGDRAQGTWLREPEGDRPGGVYCVEGDVLEPLVGSSGELRLHVRFRKVTHLGSCGGSSDGAVTARVAMCRR